MKKQILILMVALFAVTTVFGQVKNVDPKVWIVPSCIGSASAPAIGVEYKYNVVIPATYTGFSGDGVFDWYATQDVNLLDNTKFKTDGSEFDVTATGSSKYHSAASTTNEILITWTANAIKTAKPYYLVVKYTEVNTNGTLATCSAENMKVYRIEPKNTFWLDINPATSAGVIPTLATLQTAGYTYDICAATVKTALLTESGPGASTVEYTFNDNILYAVIKAAGYTGDWDATLKLSGLVDDQDVTGITWNAGAVNGTFTSAAPSFGNGTYTSATKLPATNAGTNITLAITIANKHHEGLTDQSVKIELDGSFTLGGVTYNDKYDGATGCLDQPAFADYVTEVIKARPGVNAGASPGSFVTPNVLQKP